MDARLATTHETWRLLLATVVALALIMTLGATSALAASLTACRVQNTDTGKTYAALQAAVDAASPSDRLTVKGTCIGTTVIGKKLVIEGVRTPTTGKPKLSGGGKARVLEVRRASCELRNLEVLRGYAYRGAAILNRGRLVLRDVVVRDSWAGDNSGVIQNNGRLRLGGATRVRCGLVSCISHAVNAVYNSGHLTLNDTSTFGGGRVGWHAGVYNNGNLTLNDTSTVSGNDVEGVFNNGGVVTLNDSSAVRSNWVGLENYGDRGSLVLNGTSSISDNGGRGGVYNDATLVMNDSSSIFGNRAEMGGGVSNAGSLTMNGTSSIHDNVAQDYDDGYGAGGVNNGGTLVMNDASSIHGNKAGEGGGVFNYLGTLTMTGGSAVFDNAATEEGGGIFDLDSTLDGVVCAPQAGANVYGNTPDDCYIEP